MRIDRFLWFVRLAKTRSAAQAIAEKGTLRLDGRRIERSAAPVRVGSVLAFPLYILTLGLISLVINGFLLWLTAWVTSSFGWGLTVGHFWWGVVAALIIAIINGIFGVILRPQRHRQRD